MPRHNRGESGCAARSGLAIVAVSEVTGDAIEDEKQSLLLTTRIAAPNPTLLVEDKTPPLSPQHDAEGGDQDREPDGDGMCALARDEGDERGGEGEMRRPSRTVGACKATARNRSQFKAKLVLIVASAYSLSIPLPTAISASEPEALSGPATVLSGDVIEISGHKARLAYIDAADPKQSCLDATGKLFDCGAEAANKLRQMIGSDIVQCEHRIADSKRDVDLYECSVRGSSLSEQMLAAGHAVVDQKSTKDGAQLKSIEERARSEKRGLWSGTFIAPSDWRVFLAP